jgi:hypothetical protein
VAAPLPTTPARVNSRADTTFPIIDRLAFASGLPQLRPQRQAALSFLWRVCFSSRTACARLGRRVEELLLLQASVVKELPRACQGVRGARLPRKQPDEIRGHRSPGRRSIWISPANDGVGIGIIVWRTVEHRDAHNSLLQCTGVARQGLTDDVLQKSGVPFAVAAVEQSMSSWSLTFSKRRRSFAGKSKRVFQGKLQLPFGPRS